MIWLHFRQPDGSYHLIKVLFELAESYQRWYDTPANTNIMGPGIYERNANSISPECVGQHGVEAEVQEPLVLSVVPQPGVNILQSIGVIDKNIRVALRSIAEKIYRRSKHCS